MRPGHEEADRDRRCPSVQKGASLPASSPSLRSTIALGDLQLNAPCHILARFASMSGGRVPQLAPQAK